MVDLRLARINERLTGTFCVAPWSVYLTNPDGTTGLCCINRSFNRSADDNWRSHESLNVAKHNMLSGSHVKGCEKCYQQEINGIRSMREDYNDLMLDSLDLSRLEDQDYTDKLWFDLSLGRTCNQKCRICGPHNSTGWNKDAKALGDDSWLHTAVPYSHRDEHQLNIGDIINAMHQARHSFYVELKGGEPLQMVTVKTLLDAMIRHDLHLKTAELRFITNGTLYDDSIIDMLKHFPDINLGISIDAVGELHSYTRGSNLPWQTCVESWRYLRRLPNVRTSRVANTIYIYNIFGISDLRQWARSEFGQDVGMADAILHRPGYLSAEILSTDLLQLARDLLAVDDPLYQTISGWMSRNENDSESLLLSREQFKTFTHRLDKIRNQRCLDLIPQLAQLL